ncbi:xylan 1,4-beta-xylosidase [Tetragenococcus halophilus]|uniref:DUF6440 family protein n=1 Tax=Tetragenococcus halophilus TaxID=51669 RepID=UPI000CCA5B1B|nr:DUF6440 family protein [Tetragenococcus halophilus]QXN87422.1 xylan 1,4-beta-xylosidase [Tetragenococcus halophilus]RQD33304.1 hypothetical protein C7K42_05080 [Tetragenococcus halophilus subsp. halophilus DSM 20339]WJS82586.1 xylan 1,4-beta-xylosidase [Tetragenococcus halophilus]GBD58918.1 hypothetical protein TEHN0098T_0914 [Tetragenococcus halophilus subsp. halophilus]GBD62493.1 hypothetical protein TEH11_2176 [Tetragenococcus halophilus subsp. halophilus]
MSEKRFEEVYKQGKLTAEKIIRDNETGVLYLVYQEGYGMGLTVMVDKDGKPLVDESFTEE